MVQTSQESRRQCWATHSLQSKSLAGCSCCISFSVLDHSAQTPCIQCLHFIYIIVSFNSIECLLLEASISSILNNKSFYFFRLADSRIPRMRERTKLREMFLLYCENEKVVDVVGDILVTTTMLETNLK